MVLQDRAGAAGVAFLEAVLARPHVQVVDFEQALLAIARRAFDTYGKGRDGAGLNFGDCLSYAVAKAHDLPLLFKGDDFRLTDIRPAVA